MIELSKTEQELVEKIRKYVSLREANEILALIKKAFPKLAEKAGYVKLDIKALNEIAKQEELPSVIGTTLDGRPLIKQAGGKRREK